MFNFQDGQSQAFPQPQPISNTNPISISQTNPSISHPIIKYLY